MKSNSLLKYILTIVITGCLCFDTKGQERFGELLESGTEDANALVSGYLSPALEAVSVGLGSGWLNTANPEDIPSYTYSYEEEGQQFDGSFDAPEGINLKDEIGIQAVPIPMAQLGIGIIKNTDIKIRWSPTVDIGDNGEAKLIGFGIMHDIKQHFRGIKDLPFDLSAFVGFTDVSVEYDLAAELEDTDNVDTANGEAIFDVNTWSIQGMISKKFSVLTLYGGLGYNIANAELAMRGNYTVTDDNGNSYDEVDPVVFETSASGVRATVGFMLKLAILTLHTDYTLQKYNTLTVGVGFSVR